MFQAVTGAITIIATAVTIALPFGNDAVLSESIFRHLFGRSIDVQIDEEFLDSWEVAHLSDAESISQFITAFIDAYHAENGSTGSPVDIDTHVLWTILKGVSLNLDRPAIPVQLITSFKSVVQVVFSGSDALPALAFTHAAIFQVAGSALSSIPTREIERLTRIQRQGP